VAKQLLFDDRARLKLQKGVETLAQAVAVTMGPTGRNVIIDKSFGNPVVTKDGVTVSKEVDLEDPYENMGAKLVNEVASKTSDTAGDGTTTATVLARAIYGEGLRSLTLGANPTVVRKGIDMAVDAAIAAAPVTDTVKRAADGICIETVDRNGLWRAATPQGFRFGLLQSAFAEATADGFVGTDEASVVERAGHPVAVVHGSQVNLKITQPGDLELAEFYLSQRNR